MGFEMFKLAFRLCFGRFISKMLVPRVLESTSKARISAEAAREIHGGLPTAIDLDHFHQIFHGVVP